MKIMILYYLISMLLLRTLLTTENIYLIKISRMQILYLLSKFILVFKNWFAAMDVK